MAALSIAYALIATQWYRSDVLLTAAEQRSTPNIVNALGGLAGFAGVSVGINNTVEPLAVLRSREFLGDFIEANDLMPVFYPEHFVDADEGPNVDPDEAAPDIRDAVRYFQNNVLSVSEDTKTGLVTVSIEWKDPQIAADWATSIVARLNQRMRSEALASAEANIANLESELSGTSVFTLQQSIGRLLENELQKLMLARGNDEFAFKVIDPAQVAKVRSRPQRKLTVILGTFVGGVFAVLFVLLHHSVSTIRRSGNAS
jgi:uncharacterized protein involved in exopolysaccharide biosynthesis